MYGSQMSLTPLLCTLRHPSLCPHTCGDVHRLCLTLPQAPLNPCKPCAIEGDCGGTGSAPWYCFSSYECSSPPPPAPPMPPTCSFEAPFNACGTCTFEADCGGTGEAPFYCFEGSECRTYPDCVASFEGRLVTAWL